MKGIGIWTEDETKIIIQTVSDRINYKTESGGNVYIKIKENEGSHIKRLVLVNRLKVKKKLMKKQISLYRKTVYNAWILRYIESKSFTIDQRHDIYRSLLYEPDIRGDITSWMYNSDCILY